MTLLPVTFLRRVRGEALLPDARFNSATSASNSATSAPRGHERPAGGPSPTPWRHSAAACCSVRTSAVTGRCCRSPSTACGARRAVLGTVLARCTTDRTVAAWRQLRAHAPALLQEHLIAGSRPLGSSAGCWPTPYPATRPPPPGLCALRGAIRPHRRATRSGVAATSAPAAPMRRALHQQQRYQHRQQCYADSDNGDCLGAEQMGATRQLVCVATWRRCAPANGTPRQPAADCFARDLGYR